MLIISFAIIAGLFYLLRDNSIAVLDPKGSVAGQQKDLLIITVLLMLPVVIPVFFLTFFIAWKYRAGNTKAKYQPDWDHSKVLERIWWGFPLLIIAVLGVVIWKSSHDLDPYKPLSSQVRPVKIQAVALQWKWLFIYPEQNIATVNYLRFPAGRPVNFEITADAPMNSFWIPQLGGQVYAMAGMRTKLHLMADEPGKYRGLSVNLSGEGFSKMQFTAEATNDKDFASWVASVRNSRQKLTALEYAALVKPSTTKKPLVYAAADKGLYDSIIMKYMPPAPEAGGMTDTMLTDTPMSGHGRQEGYR